jgi:PAS domain S-box-containing protein
MRITLILFLLSSVTFAFGGAAIAQQTVKVGVYQNRPLNYVDETGQPKGFFIDIIENIAAKENWQLEYVVDTWTECLANLETGMIDLLGVIAYSSSRNKIFDFTYESVLTEWGTIYLHDKSRIESLLDLKNKKIAVLHNDMHFLYLRDLFRQSGIKCRFIEAFEYEDVLELVSRGICQAGLLSQYHGLQFERSFNIKRSSILVSPQKLYFAGTKNRSLELLDAIDRHLRKLKDDEHSFYYQSMQKWFEVGPQPFVGRRVVWVAMGLVALVSIFGMLSLILRAQVKSRTKALFEKNEALLREIDQRKQTETALKQSEEKFFKLFDASPICMVLATLEEGRYLDINAAFSKITGFQSDDVIGSTSIEIGLWPDPSARAGMVEMLRKEGRLEAYPIKFKMKNGELRDFLWSAEVIDFYDKTCMLSGLLDVTDYKKAEEEKEDLQRQLQHSQKLEAVGTLTGGIAHDFNNILQAISGYAQILLMEKDRAHPDFEMLEGIQSSAQRASDLTKRMLVFSRKVDNKIRAVNLNQEVDHVAKMLKETIPRMIEIDLQLAQDLHSINADSGQIEQVLLNFGINARDAMPEGGRLTFKTENIFLDYLFCRTHLEVTPGEYVLLTVSDTGQGIPKETLPHIFEPFFTTKETGKGTGLGLSVVYGIVKAYRGHIFCESQFGSGTVFKVYFPIRPPDFEQEISEIERTPEKIQGKETILIVDDENTVRSIVKDLLHKFGYQTLSASSGEEAIEIFRRREQEIDLVILDLSMPGMGGQKCLKQLLRINHKLNIIISSGYLYSGDVRETLQWGAAAYIEKPYKLKDILLIVRQVLDSPDNQI